MLTLGLYGCNPASVTTDPPESTAPPVAVADPTSEGESPAPDSLLPLGSSADASRRSPRPPSWALVEDADLALDQGVMNDVIAGGPGFVAVGGGFDEALQVPVAAIWVSRDGTDWERVTLEGEANRGQVYAVVRSGEGFVAVGNECCPDRAAVWTSPEGSTWRRVEDQESFAGAAMIGVTSWSGGLVAVGCGSERGCTAPQIWVSATGDEWERVALDVELGAAFLSDVTASGSVLVAVGSSTDDQAKEPDILVSLDGRTWVRVVVPVSIVSLSAVIAGADGLVAAGSSTDADTGRPLALVMTSPDGAEWTVVASPAFTGGSIEDLTATADGFIAVGRQRRSASTWYDAYGADWERIVAGPRGTMSAVVEGGNGRLIAVGAIEAASGSAPAVWTSPTTATP